MSALSPEFAADLVGALAELESVEKGKTAKIAKKSGGEYSYSYADIADVVKLTRPILHGHNIAALTPVHDHPDGLACTVILVHTSGERLDLGPFPFRPGNDAQATGSAVTYHRRYALLSALGMAAEDDDGAKASEHSQARMASGGDKPATDKQIVFARRLAADLGTAANTVVPSIILEETGREAKLVDLTAAEISGVIDQLKVESDKAKKADRATSKGHDEQLAAAEAKAAAGEEPFLDDEGGES